MKALGVLFFMWAIGYFVAMNITVKGLPFGPFFLLLALGILCWSIGAKRKDRK